LPIAQRSARRFPRGVPAPGVEGPFILPHGLAELTGAVKLLTGGDSGDAHDGRRLAREAYIACLPAQIQSITSNTLATDNVRRNVAIKMTVKTAPVIAAPLCSCPDKMLRTATDPIPQSVPPHKMARAVCAIDAWSSISLWLLFDQQHAPIRHRFCGPAARSPENGRLFSPDCAEQYRGAGRNGVNYEGVPPAKVETRPAGRFRM